VCNNIQRAHTTTGGGNARKVVGVLLLLERAYDDDAAAAVVLAKQYIRARHSSRTLAEDPIGVTGLDTLDFEYSTSRNP